jgi:hypothetical protein
MSSEATTFQALLAKKSCAAELDPALIFIYEKYAQKN